MNHGQTLRLVHGLRRCGRCGEEKPLEDFSPRNFRCRPCTALTTAEWRAANPERSREVQRRSYLRRLRRVMLQTAQKRSREGGLPFDLIEDDIFIPDYCPVLGIRLEPKAGRGFHASSPTLDRLVPELGYVRGNVAVISCRANVLKSNGTAEEHGRIATWMRARTRSNQGEGE